MSEHKVTLTWQRGGTLFEYPKYPRDHTWKFDGGHEMQATVAPAYLGNPKLVDPEEAFVAALVLVSPAFPSSPRPWPPVGVRLVSGSAAARQSNETWPCPRGRV